MNWEDEEDAHQVSYIFQRLTMNSRGPPLLLRQDGSGTTPISRFFDMIKCQNGTKSHRMPPDTIAGTLYMLTTVCRMPGILTDLSSQVAWLELCVAYLPHPDSMVRRWSLLLWAAMWSSPGFNRVTILNQSLPLLAARSTDVHEEARWSALYNIWQCFRSGAFTGAEGDLQDAIL